MVKSISTIYIDSEVLQKAKEKSLEISSICEIALKTALSCDENAGTAAGAFGKYLNNHAEQIRDIGTLRKSWSKRNLDDNTNARFEKMLRLFCEKYSVDLSLGVLIAEGKKGLK